MTDALLHRLAQANPVPSAVVADLSAQLREQSRELPLVAIERRNRRRALVIAVLLAIVALIAAPALALRFGVIDFSNAEPAPPRVVKQFLSLSEGAPQGMDPQAIPGQTHRVGEIAVIRFGSRRRSRAGSVTSGRRRRAAATLLAPSRSASAGQATRHLTPHPEVPSRALTASYAHVGPTTSRSNSMTARPCIRKCSGYRPRSTSAFSSIARRLGDRSRPSSPLRTTRS